MSEIIEPEAIASALNLPLKLVQGVLEGTITESALDEYNPGKTQIAVVEKTVLTRGKTIAIIDAPAVAAAMAVYIAEQHTVGVLDADHYPILPLFTGLSAKDLPRYVNYLWDKETESRPSHKENLFLFLPPDSINSKPNKPEIYEPTGCYLDSSPLIQWKYDDPDGDPQGGFQLLTDFRKKSPILKECAGRSPMSRWEMNFGWL